MRQKYSKEEIDERRLTVLRLFPRKYTIKQLAEKLKVSEITIKRDLSFIRRKISRDVPYKQAKEIIFRIFTRLEEVERKYWRIADNENTPPRVIVSALKGIQDICNQEIKVAQDLGLIDKVADKVELVGTDIATPEIIIKIREELRKKRKVKG